MPTTIYTPATTDFPATTSQKWLTHYLNFISQRKHRLNVSQRRKKVAAELLGYCEWHHIIPRCLGGKDTQENGVWLTGREHFIAHQMLFKAFRTVAGLGMAFSFMAKKCNNGTLYQWMRIELAQQQSIRGKQNKGRKFTDEHRANIAKSLTGNKQSQETKDKIAVKATGRKFTDEAKKRLRDLRPRPNDKTKANLSKINSGSGNPMAVPVHIHGVLYGSKKDAMAALGLSLYKINQLVKLSV